MVDYLKHKSYETHRPSCFSEYIALQTTNLKLKHPNIPKEKLESFVKKIAQKRFKDPKVDIVRHPKPGTMVRETIPLSTHIRKNIAQNILTPAGVVYCLPTKRESFLKRSISLKLAARKSFKKIMLESSRLGDTVKADIHNLLQASTKIFVNAIPGGMNSKHNILYDLPGYNAITSIARQSIKYGYATVERMVEGNLYFLSYQDVANYVLRLIDVIPENFFSTLTEFKIHIPSEDEVVSYLMRSYKNYTLSPEISRIIELVASLSEIQRSYIFYAGCFRNLLFANTAFFKSFFDSFFITDLPKDPDWFTTK